ncbi:MAG: AAA family ATPase [Oscillospiraceae bacterium]
MNDYRSSELVALLEEYINQGHSQAETAKQLCVSEAMISGYRKGTYKGSNKNVERKLEELFRYTREEEVQKERTAQYVITSDYVPTSVSQDIYSSIKYCAIEKGIVIIDGDAGIGKTKAAEKYVMENPTTAIYIQVRPTTSTVLGILRVLAIALKLPEKRSKIELGIAIRSKLEGSNKLLIIDEAQHLSFLALEEIRTLSDPDTITGAQGVGIVLIGNSEVFDRMSGRQEARFAQQFSRMSMHRPYLTLNITKDDVVLLFPSIKGQAEELNFLHSICQSKWGVRGAKNVFKNAANNSDISYRGMLTMAKTMGIGLI